MTDKYDNSGTIGKNERKADPKHSDLKGKATINGVKYWIDGWHKTSDDGRPWYSLRFKRADAAAMEQPPTPRPRQQGGIPGLTEDIPF